MRLLKERVFWGVLLVVVGGLLLLQSLGVLAGAGAIWTVLFGAAGLAFLYVLRAFMGAYVEELFSAPNARERLRSMLDLLVDMFDHADDYAVRSPIEKSAGVLILASRDDRGFASSEREALMASYPGARLRERRPLGGDHAPRRVRRRR